MRRAAAVLLLASLLSFQITMEAHAEVDERYDGGTRPPLSEHERMIVRRQIELEVEAERRRAVDEARLEEEERQRLAAEREARPLALKLLEARCSRCHDAERIEAARYGLLGWHATILRKRWINGAAVVAGESGVIARYLAHLQPAKLPRQVAEWMLLAVSVIVLWGAIRWVMIASARRLREGSEGRC